MTSMTPFSTITDFQQLGGSIASGQIVSVVENETSLLSARVAEVTLQPGATLRWFLVAEGDVAHIQRRFVFRLHEGARLELLGAFFGHHQRRLEFDLRIEHLAPRTTSYAAFRGALWGASHVELRENIHMFPKAKDANGRVDGHVLMLSRDAVANIVPDLEIEQRNVRASHGATIGQVSPDQLFYLATRGMDRVAAEQFIVEGFFREIFSNFPMDLRPNVSQFISSLTSS
ncbi:MAG: SufD family Fe-S cluster assembly protein [Patescibacteria group bacterium]